MAVEASSVMKKRRRFKQISTLAERLAADTDQLREQARSLRPGAALDHIRKRIRQNETAAHLSERLNSPGLQAPK